MQGLKEITPKDSVAPVFAGPDKPVEENLVLPGDSENTVDALRRIAYVQEADPLFFKWQREEATKKDWLDKIVEIKARFPQAKE